MARTDLENLVNPAVYAPMVSAELQKAIRFAPLAQVDTTLQGQPGNTLKVSRYEYMGDAALVGEGQPIPLDELGTNTVDVTVQKIGKGTHITDEAVLSGLGDPVGESTRQIGLAMANTVDNALIAAALETPQTVSFSGALAQQSWLNNLHTMLDVFEDDGDYPYVAIVSPKTANHIRFEFGTSFNYSEASTQSIISGRVLDFEGIQIVRSRKVPDGKVILIKVNNASPALKLIMKRGVEVETDRDIVRKTTVITADEYFAAYLYNPSNVVVGTVTASDLEVTDKVYDMEGSVVPTDAQTKGQIQGWLARHGVAPSEIKNATKSELLTKVSSVSTSELGSETESESESESNSVLG